jgi:hypothetical protein
MTHMETLPDDRDEDELQALEFGSTVRLTTDGWEATDYTPPEDDWIELRDGSFQSPDGGLRTWPLAIAGVD